MRHSPKHFDEIASLFSASCSFGKLSVRQTVCSQGRRDRGGVGGVTPPLKTSCRQMKGFVGKQKIIYHKTLSYIRFTVGQYWLRKNGENSVNFVNFRKFVVCHEKFWYVRKMFGPLKFGRQK